MEEIWKDIQGYEGLYQVSNLGRVKSLARLDTRGQRVSEKILKLGKHRAGYFRVNLYKNGKMKQYLVHRLVALAFIPNPENKEQVNHIDGNKQNNVIENLEWCTHSENIQHAYRTGLAKGLVGENHPLYGKHHTEETRKKISKNHADFTGDKSSSAKQVYFVEGQKLYQCGKYTSEDLNINYKNLTQHLRGRNKTCTKNKWRFIYVSDLLQKMSYIEL